MDITATPSTVRPLWIGAALTSIAVGLFPRLNAVINAGVPIWQLDPEARVLFPLVIALSVVLFLLVGSWAWRAGTGRNRPAVVGLACGVFAIIGFIAFFLSLPIMFGGLALTLGLEGKRRAAGQGSVRQARAAMILGTVGVLGGAAVWLLLPFISNCC